MADGGGRRRRGWRGHGRVAGRVVRAAPSRRLGVVGAGRDAGGWLAEPLFMLGFVAEGGGVAATQRRTASQGAGPPRQPIGGAGGGSVALLPRNCGERLASESPVFIKQRAMTTTTATTTDALWQRYRTTGDEGARDELITRYIGLVHHAAREVAPRVRDAVSLDELVSAGSLGLMQSMEGFDPDRGLAFSTFAMRRIRGAILDELRARDPLSRSDRAHVKQMDAAVAELEQRLGRTPLSHEVASFMGVGFDSVIQLRHRTAITGSVSLEGEPGGRALADRLGDDGERRVHARLDHSERADVLREALDALPARERLILSRSYYEERPLRQIAAELGVTESRVCQLRAQAISRLRRREDLRDIAAIA